MSRQTNGVAKATQHIVDNRSDSAFTPPLFGGLKEPVRKFEDTFSAVTVIKEMFFKSAKR